MRLPHPAGARLFVDYAGQTLPVVDPATGEVRDAQVFVAVLGASTPAAQLRRGPLAPGPGQLDRRARARLRVPGRHARGGGARPLRVKVGVTSPCRYEPDLNPTYPDLAQRYGVAVIPARVRKPQDKAKVEAEVQVVERWAA